MSWLKTNRLFRVYEIQIRDVAEGDVSVATLNMTEGTLRLPGAIFVLSFRQKWPPNKDEDALKVAEKIITGSGFEIVNKGENHAGS